MGKISKIFYDEVPTSVMDIRKAAEFYYHSNIYDYDLERFGDDYESYQRMSMDTLFGLVGDAMKESERQLDIGSASLGISSMKNKTVVMANVL